MPKTKTQVIVEDNTTPPEDHPNVIAYRVSQVEDALRENTQLQRETAKQMSDKLDKMGANFVTKDELKERVAESDKEHIRIWGAINSHQRSLRFWVTFSITTGIGFFAMLATMIYTLTHIGGH